MKRVPANRWPDAGGGCENHGLKAAGDPARIGDLAAVRQHFNEAKWSAWNLVRTVTSTAAFGCLIAAAMLHRSAR